MRLVLDQNENSKAVCGERRLVRGLGKRLISTELVSSRFHERFSKTKVQNNRERRRKLTQSDSVCTLTHVYMSLRGHTHTNMHIHMPHTHKEKIPSAIMIFKNI